MYNLPGFRYYQNEAIQALFEYFYKNNGNPVVAMPTGTGKSWVIAGFIKIVLSQWCNQRIMMLTHDEKLIEQNAETLVKLWSTAPIGIYCAGLNQKNFVMPITFGSIQSVDKNPEIFGHIDLLLVDECHMISPKADTMYQNTLNKLKLINPFIKVIGFSATPYRMKQGLLTDDGIFTDICYDLTETSKFNRLVAEGYIAPLIPFPTDVEIDISGVGVVAGEYNNRELTAATDQDKINIAVCEEMARKAYDRQVGLVFANSIDHTEHLASILQSMGVNAIAIHSKLGKAESKRRIYEYKNGGYDWAVNKDMLTTGFDYPAVSFIGMVRHTLSVALWVQMLGRGTRPSPDTGKLNTLVLDFARNAARLGPINDPRIPVKPGQKKGPSEAPVKICDNCGCYNWAGARTCCNCDAEFTFKSKLQQEAGKTAIMKDDLPVVEWLDVTTVLYLQHSKTGSPPSIKVSYVCGVRSFNEWVCLEHKEPVAKRARDWWRQRHNEPPPITTFEALSRAKELRKPRRIRVHLNKLPYPEVINYEF